MDAQIENIILSKYTHAKNPLLLLQSISYTINSYGPLITAKEASIKNEPTLIKFAHFLGVTTINGRKIVERNRKKHPNRNKATK